MIKMLGILAVIALSIIVGGTLAIKHEIDNALEMPEDLDQEDYKECHKEE